MKNFESMNDTPEHWFELARQKAETFVADISPSLQVSVQFAKVTLTSSQEAKEQLVLLFDDPSNGIKFSMDIKQNQEYIENKLEDSVKSGYEKELAKKKTAEDEDQSEDDSSESVETAAETPSDIPKAELADDLESSRVTQEEMGAEGEAMQQAVEKKTTREAKESELAAAQARQEQEDQARLSGLRSELGLEPAAEANIANTGEDGGGKDRHARSGRGGGRE